MIGIIRSCTEPSVQILFSLTSEFSRNAIDTVVGVAW